MSVSQPLRRSRRGKTHSYCPGDRVEVVRDEGVAIGRLVRKVQEGDNGDSSPSPTNRWIVSFEGEETEEEITENYIGRLVDSNESDSVSNQSARKPEPIKKEKRIAHKSAKSSSSSRKAKHGSPTAPPDGDRPSTRAAHRQSKVDRALFTGIKDRKMPKGKKSKKMGLNETVVKVKMLTGTLYLYRGEHPRAEFVRTV